MDNTITGDQDQKPGMMETKSSDQQPIEQKAADQKPIEQKATDQKPMEQKAADQAAQEKAMVDNAFQHLLDTYLASRHRKKVGIITKAFNFARQAHQGVKRLSGEPYIMHPIAVAQIACEEIGLGATSISAALLHDVVEDTDYTVEDIENIFGPKIAADRGRTDQDLGWHLRRQGFGSDRKLQEAAPHDERRHPRHPHQDLRPPAQYAHAGLAAGQQAV